MMYRQYLLAVSTEHKQNQSLKRDRSKGGPVGKTLRQGGGVSLRTLSVHSVHIVVHVWYTISSTQPCTECTDIFKFKVCKSLYKVA